MATPGKIEKVKRKQEKESIEALFRDAIRKGKFVPGQRLVELDLMNQFNISQRQVRDALRRLESEGLVTIEKNRGASVRKISRKEVACILDVLDSLSLLAVRKVCQNINDTTYRKHIESSLKATIKFRITAAKEKRIHKFLDENVRFWDSLAEIVDNPILSDIRERMELLLYRLQVQGLIINTEPDKWLTLHEDILLAILDGNVKRAEKLVLKSSDDVRESILELADDVFN